MIKKESFAVVCGLIIIFFLGMMTGVEYNNQYGFTGILLAALLFGIIMFCFLLISSRSKDA